MKSWIWRIWVCTDMWTVNWLVFYASNGKCLLDIQGQQLNQIHISLFIKNKLLLKGQSLQYIGRQQSYSRSCSLCTFLKTIKKLKHEGKYHVTLESGWNLVFQHVNKLFFSVQVKQNKILLSIRREAVTMWICHNVCGHHWCPAGVYSCTNVTL